MEELKLRKATDEEQAQIVAFVDEVHTVYMRHTAAGTPGWLIGNGLGIALCSFAIYSNVGHEKLINSLPQWYTNAMDFDSDKAKGGKA